MQEINRQYKDRLFKDVFQDKENFIQLYEYITNKKLDVDVELYNIGDEAKDILFSSKLYNDIAFKTTDNKLIVMFEHQSTNNPNMALRFGLYYFNTIYNYIKENDIDLFKNKAVKIPKPEFYVVYNGKTRMNEVELDLSKNFDNNINDTLNINVKSYDINYINIDDRTRLETDNIVNFYAFFVEQVRQGHNVNEIIQNCKEKGFGFKYLENKEWIDMGIREYTLADKFRDEFEEELDEIIAKKDEIIAKKEEENARLRAELEKYKNAEMHKSNTKYQDERDR